MKGITKKSKEILHHMFLEEFHKEPNAYWRDGHRKNVIAAAREVELEETAKELENCMR